MAGGKWGGPRRGGASKRGSNLGHPILCGLRGLHFRGVDAAPGAAAPLSPMMMFPVLPA